jgi:hypothetical protein
MVDYGHQISNREAFAAANVEWVDAQAETSAALFGAFARVVLSR